MTVHILKGLHRARLPIRRFENVRFIALDSRNRLSKFWTPTGGIAPQDGEQDDSNAFLIRGGFLRQAHSGVFHLLPLGLRVQDKLERLIDKHMSSLGASKLSLSSISTESLWRQSGRYSSNSELLRLNDRKDSGFLLSPTHEEEITALVAATVQSYKDLPLRLYQIGRKYRDEKRPRQGLLRAKEFLMKDLYTFDATHDAALKTYKIVLQAYTRLFDSLKLPYLVADADSGNMGGKLSHEFHFPSPKGEDRVFSCSNTSCTYVANEEVVSKGATPRRTDNTTLQALHFTGVSRDRKTVIHMLVPQLSPLPTDPPFPTLNDDSDIIVAYAPSHVNLHAVKRLPDIDLDTSVEPRSIISAFHRAPASITLADASLSPHLLPPNAISAGDITPICPGDPCPKCPTGTLTVQKAIEVGHTFHLGTRYSDPLQALIAPRDGREKQAVHMGCHGIGVSRLIAAIAGQLADERGLNWPRVVAPFAAVMVPGPQVSESDVLAVYDALESGRGQGEEIDVVLDDRPAKGLAWKLQDADLIGYPVIVVVGRAWSERGEVEVQCRRLGVKREVKLEGLRAEVLGLLEKL